MKIRCGLSAADWIINNRVMKANETTEQYIPKSALVAELKKRFDYRVKGLEAMDNGTFWEEEESENEFNAILTRCAYNEAKVEIFEFLCFLDTFEAPEGIYNN